MHPQARDKSPGPTRLHPRLNSFTIWKASLRPLANTPGPRRVWRPGGPSWSPPHLPRCLRSMERPTASCHRRNTETAQGFCPKEFRKQSMSKMEWDSASGLTGDFATLRRVLAPLLASHVPPGPLPLGRAWLWGASNALCLPACRRWPPAHAPPCLKGHCFLGTPRGSSLITAGAAQKLDGKPLGQSWGPQEKLLWDPLLRRKVFKTFAQSTSIWRKTVPCPSQLGALCQARPLPVGPGGEATLQVADNSGHPADTAPLLHPAGVLAPEWASWALDLFCLSSFLLGGRVCVSGGLSPRSPRRWVGPALGCGWCLCAGQGQARKSLGPSGAQNWACVA